jgi:aldose 1-epimerase
MNVDYHLLTALSTILSTICLLACAMPTPGSAASGVISHKPFGKMPDGTPVDLYTLRNRHGMEVKITNYGGIVVSISVPDRNGELADVVLGYDNLEGYLKESPFFGAMVGRYGNRIANAKFSLDGKEYKLPVNNGPNCLHGGLKGFDKVVWQAKSLATPEGPALELSYTSKDGEEGFPGNLSVTAVYALTDDNGLKLEYTATTDKDTVVNLTQHSYFNLAGKGDILNHEVMIHADKFTPTDKNLIPTGELKPVQGTPFDFRKPTAIGARINEDDEQLKMAGGYDQNWVINKPAGKLGLMARVFEPTTGRVLEVLSTEPGMQFYTGNFLNGKITGKGGWVYKARSAFCMEPQHFPDSPNHPEFPSVVLRPGQEYHNTIIYRFSVKK